MQELLDQREVDLAAFRGFGQSCLLEVRHRLADYVLDHLRLSDPGEESIAGACEASSFLQAWSGPPQPQTLRILLDEFIELVARSRFAATPSPHVGGGPAPPGTASPHDCSLDQLATLLFEGVPERDRQLLELRFAGPPGEPPTLAELGRRVGLTRERVRQVLNNTLARLAHASELRRRRGLTEFLEHQFRRHGGLMRERELAPRLLERHPGAQDRAGTLLRIVLATTADYAQVQEDLWCTSPWNTEGVRLALEQVHRAVRNHGRWMVAAQVASCCRDLLPPGGRLETLAGACLRVHLRLHTSDGNRFGLREWEHGIPTSLEERLACCLRCEGAPLTASQLSRRLVGILPDSQQPSEAEILSALGTRTLFHPLGRGLYALQK